MAICVMSLVLVAGGPDTQPWPEVWPCVAANEWPQVSPGVAQISDEPICEETNCRQGVCREAPPARRSTSVRVRSPFRFRLFPWLRRR